MAKSTKTEPTKSTGEETKNLLGSLLQGYKEDHFNFIEDNTDMMGYYQTEKYFPLLKGKSVGLFTNQTATINKKHLIDTLLSAGIHIQKIFTPEHGLRGTADAGEKVSDEIDSKTGIKIVSLYGKKNAEPRI